MKPLGINKVESYSNLEAMLRTEAPNGANVRTQFEVKTSKDYELPVTNVNRERRNFEGFEKNQWYTLAELQEAEYAGTTDTDSQTDPQGEERGYTPINKKHGKGGRPWKSSSRKTKEN